MALRASGFGLLPDYDVAIFDEAHTLEAVAGEHLGIQLTNVGVDYALGRLYSERSKRGLLTHYGLTKAINQIPKVRTAADGFFEAVNEWRARQGNGGNGRIRRPISVSGALSEELRRLATAIDDDAENIEEAEHRIELNAAADRCDALADQVQSWVKQSDDQHVYWVESEERGQGRRRIRLASAPLDVGPTLRKTLFEAVPTCILTSATLCVGAPPKFGS